MYTCFAFSTLSSMCWISSTCVHALLCSITDYVERKEFVFYVFVSPQPDPPSLKAQDKRTAFASRTIASKISSFPWKRHLFHTLRSYTTGERNRCYSSFCVQSPLGTRGVFKSLLYNAKRNEKHSCPCADHTLWYTFPNPLLLSHSTRRVPFLVGLQWLFSPYAMGVWENMWEKDEWMRNGVGPCSKVFANFVSVMY